MPKKRVNSPKKGIKGALPKGGIGGGNQKKRLRKDKTGGDSDEEEKPKLTWDDLLEDTEDEEGNEWEFGVMKKGKFTEANMKINEGTKLKKKYKAGLGFR